MIKRLLLAALLTAVATPAFAQISLPHTFTAGTTIVASQVNANFTALADGALAKTGDTLTGTLTVSADVTIDGVDISDFLNGSGNVFAGTAGAVGTPSFSRTSDTNTGIYFPNPDELAITLGGVQKVLWNASGVTAFGVNIINSSGKIPALTSTYFASVAFDAANLTGSIADARLSANVPLINASNTFSGATNAFLAMTANSLTINTANGLSLTSASVGIETGSTSGANTPFIDFHSSGNAIDYDARIIGSGGTGVAGNGALTVTAGSVTFSGQTNVGTLQFGTAAATTVTAISASFSGAKFPGVTTAEHGWVTVKLSDGSTAYMPVWK